MVPVAADPGRIGGYHSISGFEWLDCGARLHHRAAELVPQHYRRAVGERFNRLLRTEAPLTASIGIRYSENRCRAARVR